ncbi:MAG: OmpA family protein, partial [Parabacteroides sp.]|nr:OmpA family protein [Parabacteroides sp.]
NGEFPSRWDLKEGGAEITQLDGANAISIIGYTYITPLFKDNNGYLPDDFTVEFDYYTAAEKDGELSVLLYDKESDPNKIFEVRWWSRNANNSFPFNWIATNDVYRSGEDTADNSEGWHRFSLSFNKRALKVYIDDKRIINIPNVGKMPGKLDIWGNGDDAFIKNFRIAKGAVPLYDKFLSDGKIITYGITFDTGKATLKPQSMGTINEIYKIMTDHPELKFSVEGHTDNTGNQASNQTLSESRALAVMDKLSEMGISKSRLATKGHGQNAPVSDNNSDEGRAKNRRVEFVKF